MRFMEYAKNLRFLAEYLRPYLRENSKAILYEQAGKFIISRKRGNAPLKWRIVITPERPLTFIISSEGRFDLHVDLSCEMEGDVDSSDSDVILREYEISIRIWSNAQDISYRQGIDAPELRDKLKDQNWNRVILRFHIDKRKSDTKKPEPLYHLHIGGIARDDEYSWIPKQITEPRFHYFPMDLVLLCEFILVNFFPNKSKVLRQKPEWTSLVRKSQKIYLEPYSTEFMGYLNNDEDTLLGHLTKAG